VYSLSSCKSFGPAANMSAPGSGRANVLHEPLMKRIQISEVHTGSEVSQEGWVLSIGVVCRDLVAGTGGGCGPDNGVGDV